MEFYSLVLTFLQIYFCLCDIDSRNTESVEREAQAGVCQYRSKPSFSIEKCCDGFMLENNKCLPCTAPCSELIVCNQGYRFSENEFGETKCLPECTFDANETCINANCVAPNKCECLPGYNFTNNSTNFCLPFHNPPCEILFCEADGCQCCEGFYKIEPSDSIDCIKCKEDDFYTRTECIGVVTSETLAENSESKILATTEFNDYETIEQTVDY